MRPSKNKSCNLRKNKLFLHFGTDVAWIRAGGRDNFRKNIRKEMKKGMRMEMEWEQVVPELPGIVLLSHGSAALGILESVRLIYPEQPNLAALSLDMGDDTEEFYRELEKLYQAFHGNCIFFVDFNGGTPCNQLRIFQIRNKVQVFGALGFSIPMVLSAIDSRRDGLSPEEIAGHAIKDGHEGIQGLCMENVQCCEED